ncbi:NADH-quinone oxidoreductase subunit N [Anaeromyxobacter diazotrophicus]|uniref:NADH-quinone oxidoreductase subunit N n=1 Tax=Anaeromyxobacter diazotrophicus TaxID=2590199 RepID=A0A7I9VR67_9BACT|nr:NADH-quinone oxidoreductase subunit N [Anaeromyxobacter diazotrophicus]GEJ58457.1 NADH-quinone oxidoreductase subunit N [Anaeromyxobacter diazotrophicus]
MTGLSPTDLAAMLPIAILVAGALVLLMSEVFLTSGRRGFMAGITVAAAALAGLAALLAPPAGRVFGGQAVVDGFSVFVTVTVCGGLALSALVGAQWLHARDAERGEFYALALFAAAGMSLLGSAADLLMTFIAIEVMSLATYALAAYMRRGRKPAEAAFKYFVLGAFSSALLLYGTALVYGVTGSTLFSDFARGSGALLVIGLGLVGAGLAFKIAAVPFHLWTPDVYEGAPTPVTAFMAAGVKTAGFAVLVRVLMAVWGGAVMGSARFGAVAAALAVLTMLFGNLLAVPQRSVKRMLAYSSIAHAGYLLVGVVSAGAAGARESALSSVLFYLAAYTATVIGAFAVVGAVERTDVRAEPADAWDLSRLAGLARRRPGLAFVMAVFMLSLAGIPPTAGFVGKFLIFKAAINAQAYGLAIIGVLTSALGAYYYLRVVVYMYMRAPEAGEEGALALGPALSVALAASAVAVVVLGIGPGPIADLARAASMLTQ